MQCKPLKSAICFYICLRWYLKENLTDSLGVYSQSTSHKIIKRHLKITGWSLKILNPISEVALVFFYSGRWSPEGEINWETPSTAWTWVENAGRFHAMGTRGILGRWCWFFCHKCPWGLSTGAVPGAHMVKVTALTPKMGNQWVQLGRSAHTRSACSVSEDFWWFLLVLCNNKTPAGVKRSCSTNNGIPHVAAAPRHGVLSQEVFGCPPASSEF